MSDTFRAEGSTRHATWSCEVCGTSFPWTPRTFSGIGPAEGFGRTIYDEAPRKITVDGKTFSVCSRDCARDCWVGKTFEATVSKLDRLNGGSQ